VEAERCGELKNPVQGRWKLKGRWVESQEKGGYLGQFFISSFLFLLVIRVISITAKKES
jgi:hypothetical protein